MLRQTFIDVPTSYFCDWNASVAMTADVSQTINFHWRQAQTCCTGGSILRSRIFLSDFAREEESNPCMGSLEIGKHTSKPTTKHTSKPTSKSTSKPTSKPTRRSQELEVDDHSMNLEWMTYAAAAGSRNLYGNSKATPNKTHPTHEGKYHPHSGEKRNMTNK